MIRKNFHTHTFRCGHAVGNDEDYVLEGMVLGLETLGFSDHVMLEGLHQVHVRGEFEVRDNYLASINHLKEKYADRIKILLGFECEAFPQYFDYYRDILETGKVDYLILGNHCTIDGGVIRAFFSKFTTKDDVEEYTDTLIKGLETGMFSCIAHPDYFADSYYKWDSTTKRCSKKIIDAAIKYDIPLEFNFACIRRGKTLKGKEMRYGYPYLPFWKMVEKSKAKVVLGLDAHAPTDLTTHLNDEGYRLLNTLKLNIVDDIPLYKDMTKNRK